MSLFATLGIFEFQRRSKNLYMLESRKFFESFVIDVKIFQNRPPRESDLCIDEVKNAQDALRLHAKACLIRNRAYNQSKMLDIDNDIEFRGFTQFNDKNSLIFDERFFQTKFMVMFSAYGTTLICIDKIYYVFLR